MAVGDICLGHSEFILLIRLGARECDVDRYSRGTASWPLLPGPFHNTGVITTGLLMRSRLEVKRYTLRFNRLRQLCQDLVLPPLGVGVVDISAGDIFFIRGSALKISELRFSWLALLPWLLLLVLLLPARLLLVAGWLLIVPGGLVLKR